MSIDTAIKRIRPNILFLIDSLGAFLTALMLGLVLPTFESAFGMPKNILYLLSIIALIYSIYSFVCYLKIKTNWRPFLLGIAVANILYCLFTLGLLIFLWPRLTQLGIIYFLLEAMIILSLVTIELRKLKASGKTNAPIQ